MYITYENEIEAACAVLCADSLLMFRKVIKVFFGTTRYCIYFLDNQKCPTPEKCVYLHQLIMDDDLIINDDNTVNEHAIRIKILQSNRKKFKILIAISFK